MGSVSKYVKTAFKEIKELLLCCCFLLLFFISESVCQILANIDQHAFTMHESNFCESPRIKVINNEFSIVFNFYVFVIINVRQITNLFKI